MDISEKQSCWKTHEVTNQPPRLENYNLFESDGFLQKGLKTFAEGEKASLEKDLSDLSQFGEILGSPEMIHHGFLANENRPQLKNFDRFGHRIDEVEYHPSYHVLMKTAVEFGVPSRPWEAGASGNAQTVRAAMMYLDYQNENGHSCPLTMTYGCIPALKNQPEIYKEWAPQILSRKYDASFKPVSEKSGATIGMAMTEKQGGSDVRSNTTEATPLSQPGPGREYFLNGHKWFCSAPMSDAFLILAQTSKGPSCFFIPRFLPDGSRNNFLIQRLKDKLGDRSNASSEIELANTWGRLIGEEGRGVAMIIEMAHHTRLDCSIAGAALMRQGLVQALHHASNRQTFGKNLIDQPLMRHVLADLALESMAATAFALRLARSFDLSQTDDHEKFFSRIATACGKYWHTKRSINHLSEAMEVLGGSGYVEEAPMARMYRQAPVNSIWEGSGNIICLDVLRAMTKEPKTIEAVFTEIEKHTKENRHLDSGLDKIKKLISNPDDLEFNARRLTGLLAQCLQACSLFQMGDNLSANTFCDSRLKGEGHSTFGSSLNSEFVNDWRSDLVHSN